MEELTNAGFKIVDLTFNFSIEIIKLYKVLIKQNEFVISKQLLRASTSIGANVEEAGAAISKRDFIAKMSIASKEAREARYWLRLLEKSKLIEIDISDLLKSIELIVNVLTKIVKSSQLSIRE